MDALVRFSEVAAHGLADLGQADAVVTGLVMSFDAEVLALIPRTRVIALQTLGSDNVDLPEATRRDTVVTKVTSVNAWKLTMRNILPRRGLARAPRAHPRRCRARGVRPPGGFGGMQIGRP